MAGEPVQPIGLTSAVVVPLVAMAALGAIAAAAIAEDDSTTVIIGVVVGGVIVAALILVWAVSNTRAGTRKLREQLRRHRVAGEQAQAAVQAARAQQSDLERKYALLQRLYETAALWPTQFGREIEQFAARVRAGEQPAVSEAPAGFADERDPFARLDRDQRVARQAAESAIVAVSEAAADSDPAQRLQVFANLGRRLQSLVNREIQMLDELEKQIEDPEILEGIFAVDHLATRIRRQAENLGVLGGARAPRQWSKPLTMVTTLRSAMQEIEYYKRVKMISPINGTLRGHNVTEIIHLLAELIENATAFSAPDTTVMLRAQSVTAGLAIEVEDRGLGVNPEDLERINDLLAGPEAGDFGVLLSDGRQIGLWVVAQLARRNDVKVRLARNIFGGVTAAVVVPHSLLGDEAEAMPNQGQLQGQRRELVTAPEPAAEPRHAHREYPPAVEGTGGHRIVPPAAEEYPAMPSPQPMPSPPVAFPPELQADLDPYRWPEDPGLPAVPAESPATAQAVGDAISEEDRPRLPKRQPGTNHLAPELRDPPPGFAPPARPAGPAGEHSPSAIAAFRSGIRAGNGRDGGGQESDDQNGAPAAPVERVSAQGESTHYDR